ncbi:MAG: hypothetical protein ACREKH_19170 [Candidatus Rokuibacteriota bacterium]
MKATKARKPRKGDAPTAPPVVPLRDPAVGRETLLRNLDHGSRLTVDDIVIVGTYGKEHEKLVLTGEELTRVLSLRDAYNNTRQMCSGDHVNLMLRGLSELLMGTEGDGNGCIEGDGAFFLSHVLDDLAARLEASDRAEQFSVYLKPRAGAGKAGAA